MKLSGNTVLITGGTSGIGFELAARLLAGGNSVIVTGRNQSQLEAAKNALPHLHTVQSDVSDPDAIASLYRHVVAVFPDLNVLINNAGIMRKINLQACGSDLRDVTREVEINLNGEIRMAVEFLPHLREKKVAAIVNVSSGLAFVPMPISPVYCATKAAVHSFTQSLRVQLKNTSVRVFEVMPPRTSTALYGSDFSKEDVETVPAMDVKNLVRSIIKGIERDRFEIRPGLANMLRLMSRIAPNVVLKRLSKPVDRMLVDPSSS